MKRIIVFLAMTVLWASLAPAYVSPEIKGIYITPMPDGLLVKGNVVHIRWEHSTFFNSPGQKCVILCGKYVISPKIPVIDKDFVWTAGRQDDGSYIPQGHYLITVKSPDFVAQDTEQFTYVRHLPKFTIIDPPDGKKLRIGSKYTIRWTHSSYFELLPQRLYLTLTPVCGEVYIAEAQVTDDKYVWEVGRMRDGMIVPPGDYQISAECSDYWGCNDVNVKLKAGSGGD